MRVPAFARRSPEMGRGLRGAFGGDEAEPETAAESVDMETTRILLVDDHVLLRAGVAALIRGLEGLEVVAEADDGLQALALVESHRPEIVLTDIAMPRMNGLELVARLAETRPEIRVVILSMHVDEEYVREAMAAGAAGYLLKDANTAELALALRTVARGQTYLSPAVSGKVVSSFQRLARGEGAVPASDALSPRQREVLRLIAEGQTTKAIARILGVSVKTVESHRSQLMERLKIHDIAGLVRYAIRVGMIDPG
jgi:DNA-binding NarL/FixJ family response regulator